MCLAVQHLRKLQQRLSAPLRKHLGGGLWRAPHRRAPDGVPPEQVTPFKLSGLLGPHWPDVVGRTVLLCLHADESVVAGKPQRALRECATFQSWHEAAVGAGARPAGRGC